MNHIQIPTLPNGRLDRHEFRERAKAAIIEQGQPATDDNGCKYRDRRGLACAVGQFIPDELYTSDMEGRFPYVVLERVKPGMKLDYDDCKFLDLIQLAHDEASPMLDFLADFTRRIDAVVP